MYFVVAPETLDWLSAWWDRKPIRTAWMSVLSAGLWLLHQDYDTAYSDNTFNASSNGQVMCLERLLNRYHYGQDYWSTASDPTASDHIYIIDAPNLIAPVFVTFDSENQEPPYISFDSENDPPVYISFDAEYSGQADFIVMVPDTLTFVDEIMKKLIENHKPAGRRYEIELYTP